MDLPITTLTWQQLAIGLWLIPLALNLLVYAPRLAAEIFADVQRARQGSYTTTSYADVVLALVISSIPLINVIALIFDAFPYALKRFGRFVGFVGDVLSKPIVPKAKPKAPFVEIGLHEEENFFAVPKDVQVYYVDGSPRALVRTDSELARKYRWIDEPIASSESWRKAPRVYQFDTEE